ncbi:uncharacterized protein BJ171DRAFT_118277 [Polychytrium aggregatum]|uniref:uncharacterized protein n=1 Tax=Polychytrium aggregatum TaxID=110093 RepID=UPI0022FE3038|nr:uncharacterized protein BJ171DRAFT_118277 [Polychytrium aggregatum]KAI9209475.1 hypothetical protein BJ171DRAFT_118277 [Polychytrium aggregatum]
MSISHVDASLPSLQAVLPLVPPDQPTATVTSVSLHANRIEFIDPVVLAKFPNLVLLDLSSNQIKKMQGLECLGKLQELNLSNNKIDVLEGLRSLVSLRRLLLSFNNIRHLDGFVELHGDQYSLQSLDLSGNKIESIGELRYLAGCNLRFLSLRSDPAISQKANPVCRLPELTASFVFSLLPQLISLDGKDMFGNLTEGTTAGASATIWVRGYFGLGQCRLASDALVETFQAQGPATIYSLHSPPTRLSTDRGIAERWFAKRRPVSTRRDREAALRATCP